MFGGLFQPEREVMTIKRLNLNDTMDEESESEICTMFLNNAVLETASEQTSDRLN